LRTGEWARYRTGSDGIELLEAAFERHVYDRHTHHTYAIGVTLRGIQRFWCAGVTHDSHAGDVITINPGEAHDGRSGMAGGYAYQMMYVSADTLRQAMEEALERPFAGVDFRAPLVHDRALAVALKQTWRAMAGAPRSLAADDLLQRSLVLLAKHLGGEHRPPAAGRNAAAIRRVRDYMHEHLERPVSAPELAKVAGLSRFQLTRQFQKMYGLPLHAYHLQVRLEQAKCDLRKGQPIAAVAANLGFSDQSHLHRRFQRSFGVAPGEWRKPG
jgi:AraC-like DNA-binding protein